MPLPDADNLAVVVTPDGNLAFLWDDLLAELTEEGTPTVRRASFVEPTPAGTWIADMAPSGGPKLGPFKLHGLAVAAERQWLSEHGGL